MKLTPLYREVLAITGGPGVPPSIGWRLEITTPVKTHRALRVLSIDEIGDYINACGDELYVKAYFPGGDYVHEIYPYRNQLKATLYRDMLTGSDTSTDAPVQTQTFSALLLDAQDLQKEAQTAAATKETGNLTQMLELTFQLTETVLNQALKTPVGGTFRDVDTPTLLKYLMTRTLGLLNNDEDSEPVKIDMVESTNDEVHSAVVVETGVPLTSLGDYLHQKISGIYSAGYAGYLKRGVWYIYPPYDVTRFESEVKPTLTIVNIPRNQMPHVERTFRVTDNQVVILASGESRHVDKSDQTQLNQGNGIRFADAGKFMGDLVTVKDNKATVLRADNTNEFVVGPRPDKLNQIRSANTLLTTNRFFEMSKLAATQGSYMLVEWQNADPSRLYPGMPTRVSYYEGGAIQHVDGVLVGMHAFHQSPEPAMTQRRHIVSAALTVFIQRAQTDTEDANG